MSGALTPPAGLLRELVRFGFAAVGEDLPDVEVHLKGRAPTLSRWISVCRAAAGCGRPTNTRLPDGRVGHLATSRAGAGAAAGSRRAHHRPAEVQVRRVGIAGTTYSAVPGIATVAPGVRWLVTIRMDRAPQQDGYPRTTRYPGLKTAPAITLHSWREELVAVAAHEARHVAQFRHGHRRSEVDAERTAQRVLVQFRDERPDLLQA